LLQLVNHGVSEELLERVKKVCSEYYKSTAEKLLNELVEKKNDDKLENADWEDVITLLDNNEWPSQTPGFK